jgi:FdhE protein
VSRILISKLLGKSPTQAPEIRRAVEDLGKLGTERPSLSSTVSLVRELLPVIFAKTMVIQAPELTAERLADKMIEGVPALQGEKLHIDRRAFVEMWNEVWAVIKRHRPIASPADRLDPVEVFTRILQNLPEEAHQLSGGAGADETLVDSALRLTVFPALAKLNDELSAIRAGSRWQHGYCPTCGSWAALGELRGLEQLRFLRCGWCAADWEFPRLQCPFCGTRDHDLLGYLSVDGEGEKHRAAVCDRCHAYVKLVTTLTPLSPIDLLVADVATMLLDVAAVERDYISHSRAIRP